MYTCDHAKNELWTDLPYVALASPYGLSWQHGGMKVLRTPEERFADLPDFGYAPRYAEGGGLRMAWVEAGPADGEPVLLLHGEPSWSFLYRKVMPVLAEAGLRAIAADLAGFGRSDKPAEHGDHTYARHVEWIRALVFDLLDLRGLTLVGQDWGGLIGLRLVGRAPRPVRQGRRGQHRAADGRPADARRLAAVPRGRPHRAQAERVPAGAVRLPAPAARRCWPPTRRRSPTSYTGRGPGDARSGADVPR